MANDETRERKGIFGILQLGEKRFWTQIGVAFVNRDGSVNLKFNFMPTDPNTTVQLRDIKPRRKAA